MLPSRSQRWLSWLLLALLVVGCAAVLWPFASAIVWAVVVAYVSWPLYRLARGELSAIGAPRRGLWVVLGVVYTGLVIAFGCGIWRSAQQIPRLRVVASLIIAYGALGVFWPFAPMHLRETLAAGGSTLSDTMHIVLGGVTVVLMLLAIGFAAASFEQWFRLYSIVSFAVLIAFGALTFVDAPRVGENLPTPWLGVWERTNIGVFLLWVIVLTARLLTNEHSCCHAAPKQPSSTGSRTGLRRLRAPANDEQFKQI